MVSAGLLARSVHQLPGLLVAYGRYSATRVGQADVIYVGEGLNASVAAVRIALASTGLSALAVHHVHEPLEQVAGVARAG